MNIVTAWNDWDNVMGYVNTLDKLTNKRLPIYFYQKEGRGCSVLTKDGRNLTAYLYGGLESKRDLAFSYEEKLLELKDGRHLIDFDTGKSVSYNGEISAGSWKITPPNEVEQCALITRRGEYKKVWRKNSIVNLLVAINYLCFQSLAGSPYESGIRAALYTVYKENGLDGLLESLAKDLVESWDELFSELRLPETTGLSEKSTRRLMNLYESFEWTATTPEEEDKKEIVQSGFPFDIKLSKILESKKIPQHSRCNVENDLDIFPNQILTIFATYGQLMVRVKTEEDEDTVKKIFEDLPERDVFIYSSSKDYNNERGAS